CIRDSYVRQRLTKEFNCTEAYVSDFTPVMGIHTGPGLLGIAFYEVSDSPDIPGRATLPPDK
ncbi:MAG: DegV family protein, partial [Dehalococcoidia bacterium]|nr:DegV family protein [Dehalococcoidia bacterium]